MKVSSHIFWLSADAYTHTKPRLADHPGSILRKKASDNHIYLSTKTRPHEIDSTPSFFNGTERRDHKRTEPQTEDDEDDDFEGWDEKTTLVAMMQDRYVAWDLAICLFMETTCLKL